MTNVIYPKQFAKPRRSETATDASEFQAAAALLKIAIERPEKAPEITERVMDWLADVRRGML